MGLEDAKGTSMAFVTPEAKESLAVIGSLLDGGSYPVVHNGGIVRPSNPSVQRQPQGKEKEDDATRRQRRSAARSRKRSTRGKGPTSGSRTASATSRVGGDVLRADYEGQVTRLAEAYPTLRSFPDPEGMWLLARSSIISGLAREATFLVALPYQPGAGPRAWGFWAAASRHWWIGPRHTNFQDGSICAYSPDDGAWSDGGDLTTLLDLYSVWALRQLHLEIFDRWPGKQYTMCGADPRVQAYYRLREFGDDELCGCGSESRRYAECCKPLDLQYDVTQLMSFFLRSIPGGFTSRQPPTSVVGFVEGRSALPRLVDVHSNIVSA